MSDAKPGESKPQSKWNPLSATQTWGLYPLIMGLASDFMSPLGPFALIFFLAFAAASAVGFYLANRKKKPVAMADRVAKFSLIGVAVFGLILVLQATAGKSNEDGKALGVIASNVGLVESVQSAVLPIEPEAKDEFDAALRRAMREKDEIEKRAAARFALTSEDKVFRQTAIEKLYLSKDPALRRQAVIGIFTERQRSSLPIVVIEDESNDPELARSMNGKSLNIYTVDSEVGAVTGAIHYSVNGTIALTGITFAHSYGVYNLVAEDDFTIRGTYTDSKGAKVRIQILLN